QLLTESLVLATLGVRGRIDVAFAFVRMGSAPLDDTLPRARRLFSFAVSLPSARYDRERAVAFYEQLTDLPATDTARVEEHARGGSRKRRTGGHGACDSRRRPLTRPPGGDARCPRLQLLHRQVRGPAP